MSVNETATQPKDPEPQKKYKTEAEAELLALSGQPRILDFDDVREHDERAMELKDSRVEDLLFTLIYYTHGVEGARKFQIPRPDHVKPICYDISMVQDQDKQDITTQTVFVTREQDLVEMVVSEKYVGTQYYSFSCAMGLDFKILPDGMWKASQCEAGWNIRESVKPDHLEFVSKFVIMTLMSMIVSVRREDAGEFGGKYSAKLYLANSGSPL